MENQKISIIVPAYNVENYITRSLDSILNQTYSNLEVIVVDDGSNDHTGTIIDEYAERDSRIIPLHKANGGVSSAREEGLKIATGDYIGFVDSDDYIEPEMYSRLIKNAIKYDADISHCGYKMVFPDGHEDLYYGTGNITVLDNEHGLQELLKGEYIEPSISNKLYSSKVLRGFTDSEIWDSNIKINEDLLMNYMLFKKAAGSVFEDVTLYHYILRKSSAATTKNKHNLIDPLIVIRLIKNDVKDSKTLTSIVYSRYIRALVRVAAQSDLKKESLSAKYELKTALKSEDFNSAAVSTKLKYMAICAVYLPSVYRAVRYFYDKITGVGVKYDT